MFFRRAGSLLTRQSIPKNTRALRDVHRYRPVEEAVDMYEPGGFHPLRLGDTLGKGRYRVVRKLGWGERGTVWLVYDADRSRHVIVKINSAKLTDELGSSPELDLMMASRQADQSHPGSQHVVKLLDHFHHIGPNGTHVCLVMDTFGASLMHIIRDKTIFVPQVDKLVIRQILQGLDFLHRSCHILHTDLKVDNLFLDVPNVEEVIANDLVRFPIPLPDMEGDIPITQSIPISLSLTTKDISIKIGDLGAGFFERNISEHFTRGKSIQSEPRLRAPEVLLGAPWDASSDIWAVGCSIFEITTRGQPFMPVDNPEENELANAEFLQAVLGPFPPSMIEQACNTGRFFNPDGSFLLDVNPYPQFDILHELEIKSGKKVEEVDNHISFLRSMIEMDPRARATTQELLNHPWLSL